jgi:hypothetical protein
MGAHFDSDSRTASPRNQAAAPRCGQSPMPCALL